MLELLFLLLPIAAAYGWYMGKRSAIYEKQTDEEKTSKNIVTGINFLLSDQKEQALELFSALAKEKGDDFEAHLTLANLLRTRGQIDNALQIHESIVASELLTYEQRLLAKEHLGKTYLQAGLLDRAENIFIGLLEEDDYKNYAQKQLLTIYQSTSEWEMAIIHAKSLLKSEPHYYQTLIGHLYCEIAQRELHEKNGLIALNSIKQALKVHPKCARANVMLADYFIGLQANEAALFFYQQIHAQDPRVLLDFLLPIMKCYDIESPKSHFSPESLKALEKLDLKREDINVVPKLDFLKKLVAEDLGSDAHIFYAEDLISKEQINVAYDHLKITTFKRPTLKLLKKFIEIQLQLQADASSQSPLRLLQDILNEQIMKKTKYRCQACGFQSHSLYWHCPSCKEWSSISLIKGIDGQ